MIASIVSKLSLGQFISLSRGIRLVANESLITAHAVLRTVSTSRNLERLAISALDIVVVQLAVVVVSVRTPGGRGAVLLVEIVETRVTAEPRAEAVDVHVQCGGGDGGDPAEQREGEEGLVDAAYHDAGLVVPGEEVAVVVQSARHPVGEKSEADGPEEEKNAVQDEVQAR